jgi:hypothetical protein
MDFMEPGSLLDRLYGKSYEEALKRRRGGDKFPHAIEWFDSGGGDRGFTSASGDFSSHRLMRQLE